MPIELKLHRGRGKRILREAFPDLLPRERHAAAEDGLWRAAGALVSRRAARTMPATCCSTARPLARGYFRPEAVAQLLDEHQRARSTTAIGCGACCVSSCGTAVARRQASQAARAGIAAVGSNAVGTSARREIAACGPSARDVLSPLAGLAEWIRCSVRQVGQIDRIHAESSGMKNVLAVVLAGGKGARLEPLTRDRAKPAVPFGGGYRIIDFTLSNCLNSGLRKILVLTQYKAMSLDRHINLGWQRLFCRELGEFIDVVPPQQRIDEHWYQGTADAVYQNIYTLEKERPEYVVILAGDHIYKMDYGNLVEYHKENQADLTVGALRVAGQRVAAVRRDRSRRRPADRRLPGKAAEPEHDSRRPRAHLGLDGHLRVHRPVPVRAAVPRRHAARQPPRLRPQHHSLDHRHAPRVRLPVPRREPQERRLLARRGHARRLLRGQHGPDLGRSAAEHVRRAVADPHLPAELAAAEVRVRRGGLNARRGQALDSIVCQGSIVSGGTVERSILGPTRASTATPTSRIRSCFDGVDIGRHAASAGRSSTRACTFRPAPRSATTTSTTAARGFTVSEGGVVVIAKADGVEHFYRARSALPLRLRLAAIHWRQRATGICRASAKKGPRKGCVPGGQRTATLSGSDWTLRKPARRSARLLAEASLYPKRTAGIHANGLRFVVRRNVALVSIVPHADPSTWILLFRLLRRGNRRVWQVAVRGDVLDVRRENRGIAKPVKGGFGPFLPAFSAAFTPLAQKRNSPGSGFPGCSLNCYQISLLSD